MSSMRNAISRRNHRERAQPAERARLGLLEKHKDYTLRARDFNAKKAKLQALKQKVKERNPDEFYFGMLSKKGTHISKNGTLAGDRGAEVLSQEASRLYKTQDAGYIRTILNKTRKDVAELEKRVVGLKGDQKRIVFVDNKGQQKERLGEVEETDNEDDDDNENDVLPDKRRPVDKEARRLRKLQKREQDKIEMRLELAKERMEKLTEAEVALDLQRAKMGKTDTVGGVTKKGIKFKIRERKR